MYQQVRRMYVLRVMGRADESSKYCHQTRFCSFITESGDYHAGSVCGLKGPVIKVLAQADGLWILRSKPAKLPVPSETGFGHTWIPLPKLCRGTGIPPTLPHSHGKAFAGSSPAARSRQCRRRYPGSQALGVDTDRRRDPGRRSEDLARVVKHS